jgi:hypothetical protein
VQALAQEKARSKGLADQLRIARTELNTVQCEAVGAKSSLVAARDRCACVHLPCDVCKRQAYTSLYKLTYRKKEPCRVLYTCTRVFTVCDALLLLGTTSSFSLNYKLADLRKLLGVHKHARTMPCCFPFFLNNV